MTAACVCAALAVVAVVVWAVHEVAAQPPESVDDGYDPVRPFRPKNRR